MWVSQVTKITYIVFEICAKIGVMKIAVSSQNKIQVTGHAGKTSRFWIYDVSEDNQVQDKQLLELPKEDIIHVRFHQSENPYAPHPLFNMDYIITGGAGYGFVKRFSQFNVEVIISHEQDPDTAVNKFLDGTLEQLMPHRQGNSH